MYSRHYRALRTESGCRPAAETTLTILLKRPPWCPPLAKHWQVGVHYSLIYYHYYTQTDRHTDRHTHTHTHTHTDVQNFKQTIDKEVESGIRKSGRRLGQEHGGLEEKAPAGTNSQKHSI